MAVRCKVLLFEISVLVIIFSVPAKGDCSDPSKHQCSVNAECESMSGNKYTCKCRRGFQSKGRKTKGKDIICHDINECAAQNDCRENTKCVNMPGSYRCECADGYQVWEGDKKGLECKDLDECSSSELNACAVRTTCENLEGSYKCTCGPGFEPVVKDEVEGVDMKCKDIDECEKKLCHAKATCTNYKKSYKCVCNAGYKGDGKKCLKSRKVKTGASEKLQCLPIKLLSIALIVHLWFLF
ncbi:adhesion G protein-coupled receptor E1-like [Acropora muricata]|uniref:adhesion G protein-coupled receptor E1-like n=1 Tax=Acropora muricata TaxID=159855 RepID=UPI0034E39CFF